MIQRPQPDEYVSFYNTYVSKVPDEDVLALMEKLKESTYHLFSTMSDEKANYAYAEANGRLSKC